MLIDSRSKPIQNEAKKSGGRLGTLQRQDKLTDE